MLWRPIKIYSHSLTLSLVHSLYFLSKKYVCFYVYIHVCMYVYMYANSPSSKEGKECCHFGGLWWRRRFVSIGAFMRSVTFQLHTFIPRKRAVFKKHKKRIDQETKKIKIALIGKKKCYFTFQFFFWLMKRLSRFDENAYDTGVRPLAFLNLQKLSKE